MTKKAIKREYSDTFKEEVSEVKETKKKEEKLNVKQAAIYFKVNETFKPVMLKKFKDSVMTVKSWSSALTKEKINF